MRRFVVIFLVLMITLGTALSENTTEFTLRKGIKFGDTMEEIKQKEDSLMKNVPDDDSDEWFTGRIAGFDNAQCRYALDDNGKLVAMNYAFGNEINKSRDDTDSNYKTLYESLVRNYGKPLGNTGGSVHLITGPAIEKMALVVYLLGALDGYKGDYIDYDEWIVESGNYNVKIDLISYYYRNKEYEYSYFIDLSYKMFTDEELDQEIKEKQQKRDEVDNDL